MKTSRKNKSRCTAVPEPCVQLCIRRKFRSCVWSLHTLHSWTLTSEPSAILIFGVVTSWSRTGNWKISDFLSDRTDRSKRTTPGGDHFDRKIFTWAEPFHLRLDRNFWTFWHNGGTPDVLICNKANFYNTIYPLHSVTHGLCFTSSTLYYDPVQSVSRAPFHQAMKGKIEVWFCYFGF